MGIFDWLLGVQEFIFTGPDKAPDIDLGKQNYMKIVPSRFI